MPDPVFFGVPISPVAQFLIFDAIVLLAILIGERVLTAIYVNKMSGMKGPFYAWVFVMFVVVGLTPAYMGGQLSFMLALFAAILLLNTFVRGPGIFGVFSDKQIFKQAAMLFTVALVGIEAGHLLGITLLKLS